ncbi:Protein CBG10127 [Caenorhabditis briggsae]|uniref:Protein CBG10127 n=1 Tax=Caenorhabditis briggsae TaxID=6238 RepID=A8XAG2_CAEBR|nr:Protein CBG10127 [Caenorhabditis briggsae]CAP29630.2 Protein CBG10127 [Caenorhabditis briggsae]
MRTQQLTLASASHGDQIQKCFDNQIPTMKFFNIRIVNCSSDASDVTCTGYTAYDISQKVIVISFKGVDGDDQLQQLYDGYDNLGLQSYFGVNGKIFKIIYNWFMLLWNGGIEKDLRSLKYKYPGCDLWINGHSLGGELAWTAASLVATSGLYKPENIKVVTMATPRMFDYDFFPYSYHIIHRNDTIPRSNKIDPHTNSTVMFHPRTQVCWCVESSQCNTTFSSCQTQITVQLNCPALPKYAYDDSFMRTQQLTFASASHGDQIQKFFGNQIPTMKLFKLRAVTCSEGNASMWYNNYMNETDQYEICEQADGNYCSDTVQEGLSMWDHIYYFNVNMPAWGRDGCPKDRSSYAQQ